MFSEFIEFIENHSILILGFGREGRSTYDIIRRHLPEKEIGISDIREIDIEDPYVKIHTGKDYLECMKDYQIVIKTPGVSFTDFIVPKNVIITCQTDLFLHFSDCMCVGITGTKGKTIVSTLLYNMLKNEGKNTCLIGNIGLPVLDTLEDGEPEIAIVEMSSHQLEFTTASPHIALVTNVYPEHLSHHNGFNGYIKSKMNIVMHQTSRDYFISGAADSYDDYVNFANISSTVIKVTSDISGYEKIYEAVEQNKYLIGKHNLLNAFYAAAAARCLGVSEESIYKAILEFKGVENRLEPVGNIFGIDFYCDSTATIPQATIAGIEAVENIDTLIFGGQSSGVDYDYLENYLAKSKITNLIGLPDTGRQICINLANRGCQKNMILAEDMEAAVNKAFAVTAKGKACLMSPAASSYNVYKDFEHKGKHFKDLVKNYRG
ncbi:MAG: UDP-N-acetylmuramoyl-L-alanine--D-glutamate ligase [Clostridia bacterium]|nr:UDP-N-acetylmuramoyl-L-alanine--D-glutamate ligase [Clostridia bacterium]